MNNIYIIGRPLDLYRTQTFVKAVMDSYKEWNLSISYFTFTRLNRGTYFIRFFKLFIYGLELLYALFQICRADYIYTPPMIIAANRFFKIEFIFARFLKKKIICEFYISTYDTMVLDRKKVSINSSIANRLLKWDRKLQTCYRTIFLNKTEAGRYSSIVGYKLSELNYVIIPLSIRERSKSLLPYYTKNANTFNIVWWGSYIPLHGLPKIISAVKELINEGHNIHLFIMGNSKEKAKEYVEMVREYKHVGDYITISNDYTFLNGRLEPFIVEKCDLAMGAFGDSEKAKNVILNKCIEAVSMKIPVLTQNSAAFQEFFPETNTSIFYSDNSVYAMKKMILNIMNLSNSEIQYHIEEAYDIYKSNFSIESSIALYSALLKNLS